MQIAKEISAAYLIVTNNVFFFLIKISVTAVKRRYSADFFNYKEYCICRQGRCLIYESQASRSVLIREFAINAVNKNSFCFSYHTKSQLNYVVV